MELLVPSGIMILLLVVGLISLVLMIWALVDLFKGRFASDSERLVWVLLIIFINPIGAILYFAIGRKNKIKEN